MLIPWLVAMSKLEGKAPLIQKTQLSDMCTVYGAEQELNFTPTPGKVSWTVNNLYNCTRWTALLTCVLKRPDIHSCSHQINQANREESSENFLMSFSAQDRPGRE